MPKKFLSSFITFCLFLTSLGPFPVAHADTIFNFPKPGTMVLLSPAYEPALIKGLTVHSDNPFLFDFILDTGNDMSLRGAQATKQTRIPTSRRIDLCNRHFWLSRPMRAWIASLRSQ